MGIGTDTPSEKFEIVRDGTVYTSINGGTNGNSTTGILFKNGNGANQSSIQSYKGNMLFYVGTPSVPVNAISILPAGNVGIGTDAPAEKLEIAREGTVYASINGGSHINATTGLIFKNGGGSYRSGISSYYGSFLVDVGSASSPTRALSILNSGNIGIGTETPYEKLSVNGKIRSKEVKVETSNWPDYVFEANYNLPNLRDTEKFIKENKHLPGIPSAKEAETDGINLGEMNGKLLQKIEELTLYIIDQDKQSKAQKQIIDQQGELLKAISDKLETIQAGIKK